jgi:carbamoylphosphate synthase small subunit
VGEALAAGVRQVDPREIVRALRHAGLRASRLQR